MFASVGAAAEPGRASFFVIQPEDLMISAGLAAPRTSRASASRVPTTRSRASSTSPASPVRRACTCRRPGENTLVKIARETAGYYAAGVRRAARSDRNGVSRQVEVRVPRPGVVVRARANITIPRAATKRGGAAADRDAAGMLREARTFRDLPLRGVGFVSERPAKTVEARHDRLKIVAMLEPTDPGMSLAAAAAGLFDENGRLVAQWTAEPRNLTRRPVVGRARRAAPRHVSPAGRGDRRRWPQRQGGLEVHAELATSRRPECELPGPWPVARRRLPAAAAVRRRAGRARVRRSLRPAPPGELRPGGGAGADGRRAADRRRHSRRPARGGGEGRLIGTVALPIGALPPGDYVVRLTLAGAGRARPRRPHPAEAAVTAERPEFYIFVGRPWFLDKDGHSG